MPDATRTSTAPPSPARRNKYWFAAQIVITAIVLWFVGGKLVDQWREFRGTPIEVHPRWGLIALSCAIVLAAYAVLIETWRRIIIAWGDALSFSDAARIWCVSNLGRYVPGKLWSIGAMAELARQRNVSVAAATGSAVVNTLVNIAAGFVIAFMAGWSTIDTLSNGHATLGVLLAAALLVALLLLPVLLPPLLDLVRRVTGRAVTLAVLPRRAIYIAVAGNIVAWGLYGVAFQLFVSGVLGEAKGTTAQYVAVYALSYVLGYLALAIPGGLGVREGALASALTALGLATYGQAVLVGVTSRLWLTVLEILPALIYLARSARPRPQAPTPPDGSNP